MNDRDVKPAGIKEIAAALGVSIGTVDRALHARPGVNAETRARVLKMAEQLRYRPNMAARSLKLNRKLRIAVHLPQQIASFFDPLRAGIRAAAATALGVTIELDFQTHPRLGEGDLELIAADASQKFDGVILTPGDPARIAASLHALTANGTAVVCVASDAPGTDRLAAVSIDARVSGAIAAELLARTLHQDGPVAAITGDLTNFDHAEKLRGFSETLASLAPHLSLLPAIEAHDRPEDAYHATCALLEQHTVPAGIYISTANSLPVFRALEERDLLGKVRIVTTDLFPELVPLIQSGHILATLYQRPYMQGKLAFEILIRHLVDRLATETVTRLVPHIVLRSNLPLFLKRMMGEDDLEMHVS